MSRPDYNQEFLKNLKGFLTMLHDQTKSDKCKKMLNIFPKLKIGATINYYLKATKKYESRIKSKDVTLFNSKFLLFPEIDMNVLYPGLDEISKHKAWLYIHMLYVSGSMVHQQISQSEHSDENLTTTTNSESSSNNKDTVSTASTNFNPFIGVNPSASTSYDINDLYSGPKVLSSAETGTSSFDISSFTQGLIGEKYLAQLSEQLKNINKADIDNALNAIKTQIGTELDPKTSEIISNVIVDISDELKTNDLSKGDFLKNINNIALNISQRLAPKIQSSGVDQATMEKSFMNLLDKYKGSDVGNQNGNMKMLYKLIEKLQKQGTGKSSSSSSPDSSKNKSTSNKSSSSESKTESSNSASTLHPPSTDLNNYVSECNQLLQEIGINMDLNQFTTK